MRQLTLKLIGIVMLFGLGIFATCNMVRYTPEADNSDRNNKEPVVEKQNEIDQNKQESVATKDADIIEETHKHSNRLVNESSPYLLQHAHNPVDWYPWGEEAFKKAKEENKVVFLSVGYATCHWCHVMERESFENEEIASIMNKHFINIKVDREERPDIDEVYMRAVIEMTGSGGWPMSVFMTPDKKPFYCGTYFPPEAKYGRPGFRQLLESIAKSWQNNEQVALEQAADIVELMQQKSEFVEQGAGLDAVALQRALKMYEAMHDPVYGGFGERPKFPSSHNLSFLMRYWQFSGDANALVMVEKTLHEMAKGGIYDHLGGGFARYSTDRYWLAPHFEKMLYDQSHLAMAYTDAHLITGKQEYADVVRGILDYVLRDMTDKTGAFYSAEDADSEGVEGKFYVWTLSEITELLGQEQGDVFCEAYGITAEGNFEDGTNIIHIPLAQDFVKLAEANGLAVEALQQQLATNRQLLWTVREKRIHPLKDDKTLTAWNGMMISALSKASTALAEPRYLQAAERAADFMITTMVNKDGRLLRRYRKGDVNILGYLEDYAYLSAGCLDLYEATHDAKWLQQSLHFADEMLRLFWDADVSVFNFSGSDAESLVTTTKKVYDGAMPSGNSTAITVLLRLHKYSSREKFEQAAQVYFKAVASRVDRGPASYAQTLNALLLSMGPSQEVTIAGDLQDPKTQELLQRMHKQFMPNRIVVVHPSGSAGEAIAELVPYVKPQTMIDNKVTVYVCEDYKCQLPSSDITKIQTLLDEKVRPYQEK